MEDELRWQFTAQMLYSFIVAAMTVMVPLYLLEKKVDIAWIGVILSVGPLSFMLIRIMFASIADDIGTKKIAIVYSISNLLAIAFYTVVASPIGFVMGTLAEGIRASGFWAIVRTELLSTEGSGKPGEVLARFSNIRQLGDGLGRVAIGFLLAYLAFTGAFIIMFALSAALLVLILTEKSASNASAHVDGNTLKRIFKRRPPTFWHASVLQLLVWLPYDMMTSFVIPLYLLSSLKLGYQEVGIVLAALSLATGAFAILIMRLGLSNRTLLTLTGLSAIALVAFPLMGHGGIWMVMPLAMGAGCGTIVGEYILVDQVYRSRNVSTDIGVLYAPLKTAEFIFLSLGGVAIAAFGFAPLFFVLALSTALFVIFGRATIRDMHK